MMKKFLFIALLLYNVYGHNNAPCLEYGCPPVEAQVHVPYVPAPPGHAPKCAKPGSTFCETPERYPQDVIMFLIQQQNFDISEFIKNESLDDFNSLKKNSGYSYGTASGYRYSKPKVPAHLYPTKLPLLSHSKDPNASIVNQTNYRYLPPHSKYPYTTATSTVRTYQNFIYKTGSSSHNRNYNRSPFDPNRAPWSQRDARANRKFGHTPYINPLVGFPQYRNFRRKRQSEVNTVSICPTKSQFISPKAALNNQGNWKYVVNLEDTKKYTQLVKGEICTTEACDGLCSLPLGYSSKCQQQYVQKRLVALEGSGSRLYTDIFWFPHGCSCQVTLDY